MDRKHWKGQGKLEMTTTKSPMQKNEEEEIYYRLQQNKDRITEILEQSTDLIKRELVFHESRDSDAVLYYTDGLVSTTIIEQIVKSLMLYSAQLEEKEGGTLGPYVADQVIKNILMVASAKLTKKFEDCVQAILSGDTPLFLDRCDQAIIISSKGWDARSVDEPQTELVVRGPRDGFTENLRTNTAHVRRRIRDPMFRVDAMTIGTKTQTDINIAYIKGTVKEGLVDEVKHRLEGIKIDAILDSGYIEEFIEDAPLSPFATIQSTERPDKVASAVLEGRVAIFVDGSPFTLIVPNTFWNYLQASDDYYSRYWVGSFFRLIRYIAFIVSLTLPSIYVMLVSFHQEMIPTTLALTIASGREAVPFPVIVEALVMELAFELLREAGLRMPKPVGSAVSIIGSLVIGQAAVQAGIISPFMVIIVAFTGISSFAIPNYAASFSIRVLRFPLLIASGTMGLLGFAAIFSIVVIHALSIRSFGEPYLAPVAPFQPTDQKDVFIRVPWWSMNKRPELANNELRRESENQMPKPPPDDSDKKKQKQKRSWRKKDE